MTGRSRATTRRVGEGKPRRARPGSSGRARRPTVIRARTLRRGDLTAVLARATLRLVSGVRFARSGEVDIAYRVVGGGPVDLVYAQGALTHLEIGWEGPASSVTPRARYVARTGPGG